LLFFAASADAVFAISLHFHFPLQIIIFIFISSILHFRLMISFHY
jgi:hypothetical protein